MEKIFLKFDMVTKEYTIEKDKINDYLKEDAGSRMGHVYYSGSGTDDYFCGVGYIKIKST